MLPGSLQGDKLGAVARIDGCCLSTLVDVAKIRWGYGYVSRGGNRYIFKKNHVCKSKFYRREVIVKGINNGIIIISFFSKILILLYLYELLF